MTVNPAKTGEPIEMPFWMWTRVGPRNYLLDVDLVDIGSPIFAHACQQGTETVQVTPLRRTLASSPESECASPSVL